MESGETFKSGKQNKATLIAVRKLKDGKVFRRRSYRPKRWAAREPRSSPAHSFEVDQGCIVYSD